MLTLGRRRKGIGPPSTEGLHAGRKIEHGRPNVPFDAGKALGARRCHAGFTPGLGTNIPDGLQGSYYIAIPM